MIKLVRKTAMDDLLHVTMLDLHPANLEAVCRTSDGFYMGQIKGDLGYNVFVGKPNSNPQPETTAVIQARWDSLSPQHQDAVLRLCARSGDGTPIPLAQDFKISYDSQELNFTGQQNVALIKAAGEGAFDPR